MRDAAAEGQLQLTEFEDRVVASESRKTEGPIGPATVYYWRMGAGQLLVVSSATLWGQDKDSPSIKDALAHMLFFVLVSSPTAWGNEWTWFDDLLSPPSDLQQPSSFVPHALPSQAFDDFRHRLEMAVASRDVSGIRALYRIGGVDSEAFKSELGHWQEQMADSAEARVSLIFKELSTLSPRAREMWTAIVRQRTKSEVTHVVGVCIGASKGFTPFPSVLLDDRLWIIPSDAVSSQPKLEPGQPARTETPGPRR